MVPKLAQHCNGNCIGKSEDIFTAEGAEDAEKGHLRVLRDLCGKMPLLFVPRMGSSVIAQGVAVPKAFVVAVSVQFCRSYPPHPRPHAFPDAVASLDPGTNSGYIHP